METKGKKMIRTAKKKDSKYIAKLLATFSDEIQKKTGAKINNDKTLIKKLFIDNLNTKFKSLVYEEENKIVAFITFYESFSLYADGSYYTISELYVKPKLRSQCIGKQLLKKVVKLAKNENKTRIELTTPPLPEFQKSLDFYIKNGFDITGGKKVKYILE